MGKRRKVKHKVVYSSSYGGFGLSRAAAERLIELGVKDKLLEEKLATFSSDIPRVSYYGDLPRHDPRLVKMVEELGSAKASGPHAHLLVRKIKGSKYRIDEYDGSETIQEPRDINDWVTIED